VASVGLVFGTIFFTGDRSGWEYQANEEFLKSPEGQKLKDDARKGGKSGKGERGQTSNPDGTNNPFKKMKPDPNNDNFVIYKDADGKTKRKPRTKEFDEYWNNKHK
jgi:hypothetical protein